MYKKYQKKNFYLLVVFTKIIKLIIDLILTVHKE
jgi:hypothetical protein